LVKLSQNHNIEIDSVVDQIYKVDQAHKR